MLAGDAYSPFKRFLLSLWMPIFWGAVRYERWRISKEIQQTAGAA
jgi:hypothetical protein